MKKEISKQGKFYIFSFIIALVVIIAVSYLANFFINRELIQERKNYLQEITELFSDTYIFSQMLTSPTVDGVKKCESFLEKTSKLAYIDCVIILDSQKKEILRYHNPKNKDKNLDNLLSGFMNGREPDLRLSQIDYVFAQSPVYSGEGKLIGHIGAASIYSDDMSTAERVRKTLLLVIAPFLAVLIFLAWFFEQKNRLLWYKSSIDDLSKKLKEQNSVFDALYEGIIVCNYEGRVMFVNKEIEKYYKKFKTGALVGKLINDDEVLSVFTPALAGPVLAEKKPIYNKEIHWMEGSFIVNCFPLYQEDVFSGILLSFRELTDLKKLAEELTGVRNYADALRSQTHEFMNRLFVIDGLVKFEKYDEARKYISDIIGVHEREVADITGKIKDIRIAGLIMGKISKLREQKIDFSINEKSALLPLTDQELVYDIIVILSNLIDNASDAVSDSGEKNISALIRQSENEIEIKVDDSGSGMSKEVQDKIFDLKFSTKGENRGWGMHLVKTIVDRRRGYIEICSEEGGGTCLTCVIKLI